MGGTSQDDLRDYEVLICSTTLINKLGDAFQPFVRTVLGYTFEVTHRMITQNMEDYPEHRLALFRLMHAITVSCFNILLEMSKEQMRMIIGSFSCAIRHKERNVAKIGLQLLWLI